MSDTLFGFRLNILLFVLSPRQVRQLSLSAVSCLLLLAVSGCERKPVVNGIDERQSTEILIALFDAGISADREQVSSGRNERFSIRVPSGEYHHALKVLRDYGLPREQSKELSQILNSSSLVPMSPEMANVQLDYALAADIERLLDRLPGVMDAQVVVRTGGGSRALDHQENHPTATVVIRYVPRESGSSFTAKQVQDLVARSVPGLTSDRVNVTTNPISRTSAVAGSAGFGGVLLEPFSFRVSREEQERAKIELFVVLLAASLSSIIIGFYVGWRWEVKAEKKRRQQVVRRETTMLSRSYLLENAVRGGSSQQRLRDPGASNPPGSPEPER